MFSIKYTNRHQADVRLVESFTPENDNDVDSFSCEQSLHMPSLRKDNIFQEFENEVVRIGCFSTSSDNGK